MLETIAFAQKNDPAGGPAVVLEDVAVLGTRLHGARMDSPSLATIYDRKFIDATGAMRLADFLNLLPQNYTGAGSGRSSAPNDANPYFGVRTETSFPAFSFVLGASDVPIGQTGVSGANLRGLGSASTLVLVDGRRRPIAGQGNRSTNTRHGFVELNTIPLGMVERIEVLSDGASALYGSDAIGGVINVVLKKNYRGAELVTDYRGAFDGGAHERHATLSGGFTSADARLRGMVSVDYYDRAPLWASQRAFSAEQDHSGRITHYDATGKPVHGFDFRLNWSYPPLVQARTGNLNGVLAPDGQPTRFALVPAGAIATPAAAGFTGVAATSAAGISRMNTSRFIMLVSPQETNSARASFEYDLGHGLVAYAGVSGSAVRGRFEAQPPVSSPSASTGFGNYATVVPATINGQPNALNPFGQDVLVGMAHEEFGPTRQTTRTWNHDAFAGLAGSFAQRWVWDATAFWSRDRFEQRTVTLDPARFTAALAATDPAQRFNPFVDARAGGANNAALYRSMGMTTGYNGSSGIVGAQFQADGPLFELPGGEVLLAAGGEISEASHVASGRSPLGAATQSGMKRLVGAGFVELAVPLVGPGNALPLVRRVDLQLAGRFERYSDAGRSTVPKVGLLWSPTTWLSLRTNQSRGFRAPSLTEYQTIVGILASTVTDPRRTPVSTPGVSVMTGSNRDARPETSEHESYGVIVSPRFLPGLSFSADFYRTRQRDLLQELSVQAIVNNEGLFSERITRAPASAQDIALGQPGQITAVDARFVSFGKVESERVDFSVNYTLPRNSLGSFRLQAGGVKTLESRTVLRPGVVANLEGDTGAPPRENWSAMLLWERESWTAALFARYIGGFASNNAGDLAAPEAVGAMTVVSVNAGYTFRDGLWHGFAKGAKINVGVGNVFDEEPPFADTIFGYNGALHSPLGRTYSLSLSLKF